uniref:NADH-ubiquinone oxidoreductase chain 2 n=1 Tax=Amerotyphlops reticulatus TaxID=534403 RepID=B3GT17_9SAUR|nr:NADH dehydrogenase subunit 2 [Amerotyphlops reticulatus]ACD85887.1 NADH dehydrogenase subunit 2 [Amerotyphlops reticulatus]
MSPISMTIIISSIILGTVITASSQHWLFAWLGLELNTLAMIPMMAKPHHPRAMEATTKYFLTQAMASSVLLFAATTNALHTGLWEIKMLSLPAPTIMMTLALLMKMGSAPFHFWVPEVLQGVHTKMGLIILTWQKLAPMALILSSEEILHQKTLLVSAILSILLGGWGGLNQTQLRKLMAFSSISHVGWMLLTALISPKITIIALVIYITLTTPMFLSMMINTSKTIKDIGLTWNTSPHIATMSMLVLMSLSGMPPLTGFMPKWIILKELANHNLIALATMAATFSVLSLYFYLHLSYTTTMTIPPNTMSMTQKWRFKQNKPIWLPLLLAFTILLLPLSPMFI